MASGSMPSGGRTAVTESLATLSSGKSRRFMALTAARTALARLWCAAMQASSPSVRRRSRATSRARTRVVAPV